MLDSKKIKKRMKQLGLTQKNIADKNVWDCALPTVSQKINGVRPMTLQEANGLAGLLSLTEIEYYEFFFKNKLRSANKEVG